MEEDDEEDPIEITNTTVQEQIKAAEEKYIGERIRHISSLQVEFNLGYSNATFKAQTELLHFVHKLAVADKLVYVLLDDQEEAWTDDKNFPSNNKFMEEFHVRQDTSPNGYITMVMYVTIAHTLKWNKLKFADPAMHHLNNKRVYAHVNEFNKQKTSTPGAIGRVHPKLVNLRKLKDILEIGMKSAQ
eukprot:6077624-Ditylum_brightwellii.AAC.1